MAAGQTYEPIATSTVSGSSVSSITFSSIPGTYTDLVISVFFRSTRTPFAGRFGMQVNSDTSSIYSNMILTQDGAQKVNGTYWIGENSAFGTTTSNIFTPVLVYFNNYSNTTTYKPVWWDHRNTEASGNTGNYTSVGTYRSTSAITTIKIYDPYGGNVEVGSSATLYGITAA